MVIEIIQSYPKASIIALALAVSFFITLVNYFVLDKDKIRDIKSKQKAIQEEMKKHKDNPDKIMALNKELMGHAGEMMKHSLKPMLITLIPALFILSFMRSEFATTGIAKSWIWWYIGASVIGSIVFRKLFKLP